MKELIFIVEEDPSGSFSAHAEGHAIMTQADSIELLSDMIREAVELHFDDEPNEPLYIGQLDLSRLYSPTGLCNCRR